MTPSSNKSSSHRSPVAHLRVNNPLLEKHCTHSMVYAPQRRHAVASVCPLSFLSCPHFDLLQLATTTHAIGLLQHLYTPNALVLISRILAQIQITGAAYIHPHRSLFALFLMLTFMNMAAVLLHLLDFVGGMSGGKGLMLDFVGQGEYWRPLDMRAAR